MGICVAPNRSSYLRCSHPRLTWPIVASRLVASLQSKFAAGTAFSLLFSPFYFSFASPFTARFFFLLDRLILRHNRSCNLTSKPIEKFQVIACLSICVCVCVYVCLQKFIEIFFSNVKLHTFDYIARYQQRIEVKTMISIHVLFWYSINKKRARPLFPLKFLQESACMIPLLNLQWYREYYTGRLFFFQNFVQSLVFEL